ncbi:amino acid racemase [Hafnia alvei]|uniref:aspartate/glutamate racemase family protein n=1 Tax=Hafnia alvei TaxID=569 RepID=UPI0006218C72|nr:amino acid racemase [Hafnia alvei]KKI47168.1 aspartate racemase [Hafnia alvei]MDU3155042.1 amino acid racemase [Hafnia alvei]MEB7887812.1 amino acid racemase [Hafnia alvei]QIP56720.1 amino acid racemase [Hafnia alvei]TBL43572.1 amino acid racemase [Hafnia alvei]
MQHTIGILGGMGPAATADMLSKFVHFRHVGQDQQHIPIIACSIPDIPDRSACLLSGGPSPYDYLERYLHMLEGAGAECIVIPCNTAHYWFERLQHSAHVEMINILDATLAELPQHSQTIGLLATDATLATGLYQRKLVQQGKTLFVPEGKHQRAVMQAIYAYKAGDLLLSQTLLFPQIEALIERGVDTLIMGCTEIPLIINTEVARFNCTFIDSTAALVRAAIRWYEEKNGETVSAERPELLGVE